MNEPGRSEPSEHRVALDLVELRAHIRRVNTLRAEIKQHVAELRVLKRKLQAQLTHAREIIEIAPVSYLVTDRDGTIRRANRSALAHFARVAREAVGQPLLHMVNEDDRPELRSILGSEGPDPAERTQWVNFRPEAFHEYGTELIGLVFATGPVRDS
jgi:PAS domain S-box-containing protein